jgi:glucosamine kinase
VTVIIGADAGGTATTAAVWRAGQEVGRARGGAGVVRPGRAVTAAARIADTVRQALTGPRLLRGEVLVVGAAGAGRPEEREELRKALRTHDLADRLVVTSDVELALAAAFGTGPGLLLIAGTGSIATLRTAEGTIRRAGGLGWQIGDEGSAYWIARRALEAIGRAQDGRGIPTDLSERLPAALRLPSLAAVTRWSVTAAPGEVAALAPVVVAAAEAGDATALEILDNAATELVALVRSLADAAAGLRVALSGGLAKPGGPLHAHLVAAIREATGLEILNRPVDPVAGALVLAGVDEAGD